MSLVLGIDIGGTGVKAAVVDTDRGILASDKSYHLLDRGSSPDQLSALLVQIVSEHNWNGKIGIGYPGVVIDGQTFTAAHLSESWIESDTLEIFSEVLPGDISLINDADAAALAEMRFGAGQSRNHKDGGTVLLVTLGTGLGSGLVRNSVLVPNTEFGHLMIGDSEAENLVSGKLRTDLDLSWESFSERFNIVLAEFEKLLWPDMIIIGGGVSENFDKFAGLLNCRAELFAAKMQNHAGLIGAALACEYKYAAAVTS